MRFSSTIPSRKSWRRQHSKVDSNHLNLLTLFSIFALSLVLAQDGDLDPNSSLSSPSSIPIGGSTLTETVTLSQPLQTSSITPTSTPTGSGSASSTSTAALTTSIPFVNLDGQQVPFLLQRPIDSNQLQSTSQSSSKNKKKRTTSNRFNLFKRSENQTPLTPDVYFSGCDDSDSINGVVDPNLRVNVSAIYAQLDTTSNFKNLNQGAVQVAGGPISGYDSSYQALLRITALASIQDLAYATDESRLSLSAMRVETTFLTFPVYTNSTFLCDQVFPTGPDTVHPIIPPSCTYGPGSLAFGAAIPLNHTYGLGTLWTRIRLVDPSSSAKNIACVRVAVSPYYKESWYWELFFWLPVALSIAYFFIGLMARIVTSVAMRKSAFKNRAREGKAPTFINDSLSPTVVASFSSQGLVSSPALLRFATPGLWDIILHTQWIAILGTFAVKWPEFVYPVLRQGAWAALLGNVTYVQENGTSARYDALSTNAQLPNSDLGTQIATNVSSPLYMNTEAPNVLLNLGGSRHGLDAFALVNGLSPNDVFGTCLAIWCTLVAAILAISGLVFVFDLIYKFWTGAQRRREDGIGLRSSGDFSLDAKDLAMDSTDKRGSYGFLGRKSSPLMKRTIGLHGKALHGNLIRALILFHLPITLFSTYQIAEHDKHSLTSVALAGLSLALLGILAPVYLIWRISFSTTQKLYDDIGTLLSLGPIYNTYSPGSQLFYAVTFAYSLIVGITLGAAQSSAAAQTIIFLVMEILLALASSLWLPWGDGAMQGPLSFLTSVLRIISAVLLILLTPLVGFGHEATSWITYVILLLQAIFFVLMALVLFSKILEALTRVFWKVPFDERASRNAGIGGVIRRIRRRKYKTIQLSKAEKRAQLDRNSNSTTQALIFSSSKNDGTLNSGRTSPGMNTPGGKSSGYGFVGQRGLGNHSRQASYASHLDAQMFGGNGNGTLPRTPMEHHLSENSPYSAYLRGDPNDEGIIMAALPPTTPGVEFPSSNQQQNRSGRSFDAENTLNNNPTTPKSSFVRLGGGRATDTSPYQSLPSRNNDRHRTSNSSGTDLSYFVDPRSSFHALNNTNPSTNLNRKPNGDQDFSSTALAQRSATMTGKSKKKNGGGGGFWRRRGNQDDEDSTDDEDEVWNSNPSERGHGPWRGIAKMGGAFTGFKNKFGIGNQVKEGEQDEEEGDSLPPNPSAGFQVVRQPNRLRGNQNSNEASPSNSRPISLSGVNTTTPNVTSNDTTKVNVHVEDEEEDKPRVHTVQPPPFGSAAALALEAANSSNHGHGDGGRKSEGGEERYWLPPGAAPPNPNPNSQRSDTRQRRKSAGMQALWQQENRPKSQDEIEALENRRNLNQSDLSKKSDSESQKINNEPPQLPNLLNVNEGTLNGGLFRGSTSLESDRLTNSSTSRLAKMEPLSADVIDANDDD